MSLATVLKKVLSLIRWFPEISDVHFFKNCTS
nr:MAG TPA: hypothetical protein [Caudoviricetes sp.]